MKRVPFGGYIGNVCQFFCTQCQNMRKSAHWPIHSFIHLQSFQGDISNIYNLVQTITRTLPIIIRARNPIFVSSKEKAWRQTSTQFSWFTVICIHWSVTHQNFYQNEVGSASQRCSYTQTCIETFDFAPYWVKYLLSRLWSLKRMLKI